MADTTKATPVVSLESEMIAVECEIRIVAEAIYAHGTHRDAFLARVYTVLDRIALRLEATIAGEAPAPNGGA